MKKPRISSVDELASFILLGQNRAGFPEEDDPWIAKFMMETSIPEEYDPITVFVPPGSVTRNVRGFVPPCRVGRKDVRVWFRV